MFAEPVLFVYRAGDTRYGFRRADGSWFVVYSKRRANALAANDFRGADWVYRDVNPGWSVIALRRID